MNKALRVWCLGVLMASLASAQQLYVPAAAHTSGAAGTVWRTDLEVKAKGGAGASIEIALLEERTDNSEPAQADFSLEPGQSLRFPDVVDGVFGLDGSAALRITATDGSIMATSRTYNSDPNGTYGQFIPAFDSTSAAEAGFDYTLMQLTSSQSFRTNVGFVNTTAERLSVEVDLYTAAGEWIGPFEAMLRPYEMRQVFDIFGLVTDEDVEAGYAVVRTRDDGGRFFAYASVVDNLSGDAVYIPAQLEGPTEAPADPRVVVFEAFMRYG